MRVFILHIVFLSIIQVINAQQWNVYNTPRSRQIHDVAILSQNNYVIVGGNPSNDSITYMAHSSSAGESWENFTDLFPGKMINTILFKNNITGYCAGDNEAFYKTSDGGKNWSAFSF
ncbi:MAG: hypothetical protein PHH30_09605, partial [Bacteroidales bacterium]|nr:hypothetical protein [Bacteroidales bacterium]